MLLPEVWSALPAKARAVVPREVRQQLRRTLRRPRWGNLRRQDPFSSIYGLERGTPIDRRYLREFFAANSAYIRGAVLEVRDPEFAGQHPALISSIDIIDIDHANPRATIVGDLADPNVIARSTFDCILAPQTLQYVQRVDDALRNLWNGLVCDGTLLVTVPVVSVVDTLPETPDLWRFTENGLRQQLSNLGEGEVSVCSYGNLTSALAFLMGLALEELTEQDLAPSDPRIPIVACGRITRVKERA